MKPREPIGTPAFRVTMRDFGCFLVGAAILLLIYQGPPLSSIGGIDLRFGLTGPSAGNFWKWAGAGLLAALVLWGERRKLSTMLISKPSATDMKWVLYAFGGVMTWSWLLSFMAPQEDNSGIGVITSMGVPAVAILIMTAAITEEVAFRGYLQERLGGLLRSRWLGAAVSLLLFVAPHVVFFGPSWLLHQLPGALALVGITLFRRNLPAAMVLHLLLNAPILIPTVIATQG